MSDSVGWMFTVTPEMWDDLLMRVEALEKTAHKTRATRIPAGYRPAPETIIQIRVEFPGLTEVDLRREHLKFCDYWTAKSGKDATKMNWDSTWKNWMRRADEQGTLRQGHPPNRTEAKINGYLERGQRLADRLRKEADLMRRENAEYTESREGGDGVESAGEDLGVRPDLPQLR